MRSTRRWQRSLVLSLILIWHFGPIPGGAVEPTAAVKPHGLALRQTRHGVTVEVDGGPFASYVIDEANIESHGMGFYSKTLAAKSAWQPAHLDRVQRMYERDKNHACVILWSLGNEAGNGPSFQHAYAWLKRRDLTRPVQYENARIEPMWDTERLEMIDYNTDIYVRPLL